MNRTRVKICGITRPDDARYAIEARADAIGLVFWPGSRRFIDDQTAMQIRECIPTGIDAVGVFLDADAAAVREKAGKLGLTVVQLSGRLNGGGWGRLQESVRIVRSISMNEELPEDVIRRTPWSGGYLLDSGPGGTGETFDWKKALPFRSWCEIWLAGGLNPQNVGDAIRTVRPYAVDVSSGVELSPGIKSAQLIRDFIEVVRRTDRELDQQGQNVGT